ncbi:MAG: 50S ribosomal protein L11 methyltransferase [Christensenellaceae bacterium]|jgi:ribosomal protein L11 methyltransferase|nr:50S ribosomal protein L11 methyltransferase [Christensenellaceae bacterium]
MTHSTESGQSTNMIPQSILLITTPSQYSDFVSVALFEQGAEGVEVKNAYQIFKNKIPETYVDYVTADNETIDPHASHTLSAIFPSDKVSEIIDGVKNYLSEISDLDIERVNFRTECYSEIDWLKEWKKCYKPFTIGRTTVVPNWMKPPNNSKTPVFIEPGMAFGTGQHVTTKLLLKLLNKYKFRNKIVLDIGTGSGILGISAALQGAKHVYMNDIDPVAVALATENAKLNNVLDKVTIQHADLAMNANFPIDLVLANLTADLLIRLSQQLKPKMNLCSHVFCSGILIDYKKEVIKSFYKNGFELKKELEDGEWCAMIFNS